MSIINTISQRILQLDGGAFQQLCNAFLAKEYPGNLVSYGAHAGTTKTTKGTPDTYFSTPDGKYIFVEYTTQQTNLPEKIKADLKKCLDENKTHVPLKNILEIVYCHTSSNLSPGDDLLLKDICKKEGIKLTILGLDQIAESLYQRHREIAKDHLGVEIGTGQIKELHQFIREYDANVLAAPLKTEFLFREKELDEIDKAYEKEDVVVLTGKAGMGKSRIALHYASSHAERHSETLFCISDNALPLYEDLQQHINTPGNYFLFIDDANELSGLKYAVEYATNRNASIHVKILITVRDYALKKVVEEIRSIVSFTQINISSFTDEQIKTLLRSHFSIHNERYLERIVRISEGNARIAMLAGKIASEANRLESINDLTQLFESYYGNALRSEGVLDRKILICAGIAVFLSPFRLDCKESLLPILDLTEIGYQEFIECLYSLHEKDLLHIHYNTVVRFGEQCLGNYILKLVFIDKKYIALSDMIDVCFNTYYSKITAALDTLIGVFQNDIVHGYIKDEICKLWTKLQDESSPLYHQYVKAFYHFNMTEGLSYVQMLIEQTEINLNIPSNEYIEKEKNHQYVNDDILEILGGYADTVELETALDLFFIYYQKRLDKFMSFYHAAQKYYGIRESSYRYDYYTQKLLIQKFEEYSQNWTNEHIIHLFLETASNFLKVTYSPAELTYKNKISIYTVQLVASPGSTEYRHQIWNALRRIKSPYSLITICRILHNYANGYSDIHKSVIENDAQNIIQLICSTLNPENIEHCLIVKHIDCVLSDNNCLHSNELDPFLNNEILTNYQILNGPEEKWSYAERECLKEQQIYNFIQKNGVAGIRSLIDISQMIEKTDRNTWSLGEGLRIAFEAISSDPEDYTAAIQYYIVKDTPLNLSPNLFLQNLFRFCDKQSVYELIFKADFAQRNVWQYAFFSEIPDEHITSAVVAELYAFLQDRSDCELRISPYRDVWFLQKYTTLMPDIFISGCNMIYEKYLTSSSIAVLYFILLFNDKRHSPAEVIEKFANHYDLLEKIYIAALRNSNLTDCSGEFLSVFYSIYPSIVQSYAKYVCELIKCHRMDAVRSSIMAFYQLSSPHTALDRIVEELQTDLNCLYGDLTSFFKMMLLPEKDNEALKNKQDAWIKHMIINYYADEKRMYNLFGAITHLKNERRINYIKLFLEQTSDYNNFEKIPLTPLSYSWSGSAVPMYTNQIEFLKKLLPELVGLRFLKHRQRVEECINTFKKQISREQIIDILEARE